MSASAIRNFFDSLPPRDILPHAFYERFLDTITPKVSSVPITLFFAFMNSVLHPGTAPWGPVVGNCEKLLYHLKGEMTQSEMCYCIDALQRHMRWRYNKEFAQEALPCADIRFVGPKGTGRRRPHNGQARRI